MSTKNIEFKASLNTSEMDSKIQALQQKLRTIASQTAVGEKARSIYGETSPMTERAQKLQESFNQRNLQYLREEFTLRDRLYKAQENKLKQINDLVESSKKGSQEQLKLEEEKVKTQEKLLRLQSEQNAIAEKFKGIKGTTEGLIPEELKFGKAAGQQAKPPFMPPGGGGGEGGGIPPSGEPGDEISKMLRGGLGMALKAYGISQIVQRATGIVGDILKHEQEMSIRETSIAQLQYETSGRREELEGDYLKSKFFQPERAAGTEEARGMAVRTGTFIKSFIPAFYEGVKGAGGIGDFNKEAFSKVIEQYQLESEKESIQAQLAKNPELSAAYDYFSANRGRFLQAQQLSGMGDQELMSFLGRQGGQFTIEQKLGAMQSIYGAGGSTAQGRQAGQALQLQREFGIQSAGQVIGALSGNIGGGATGAESVTRKILSEAFSTGLDASKFSRETERFLNITAKFVEESGARTPEGMARVAESMTPAVMGTSMADINAAAGAMANFQSKMGEGAGEYSKALQQSKLRRDPNLGKLSEEERMMLSNLSPADILAGSDFLKRMSERAGFTDYSQFTKSMLGPSGVKSFGATYTEESAQRMSRIGQIQTEAGFNILNKEIFEKEIKEASPERKEQLENLRKEALEQSDKLTASLYAQGQISGKTSTFAAQTAPFYALETEDILKDTFIGKKPAMPAKEMTTFDLATMAAAEGEQTKLENATKNMERYSGLVGDVANQTENLAKAIESAVNKINQTLGMGTSTQQINTPYWSPSAGGTRTNTTPSVKPGKQ